MKRFIDQSGAVNRQTSMDNKKAKIEAAGPSCVVHIRGVPSDISEAEIIHLGLPFGKVVNLVISRGKHQALIELPDEDIAQTMIDYYSERPAIIRSKTVYMQFSSYKHLETSHSQQFKNALQIAEEMTNNSEDVTKTILRIIVDNMQYPITIDILKLVFSKHGEVQKIVTYYKNNGFQALIQFSDALSARLAMQKLNNQNIYNGCCTLHIDYSHLRELQVKFNNDKTFDFTNPNLPGPNGSGHQSMEVEDGILGSFNGSMGGRQGMNTLAANLDVLSKLPGLAALSSLNGMDPANIKNLITMAASMPHAAMGGRPPNNRNRRMEVGYDDMVPSHMQGHMHDHMQGHMQGQGILGRHNGGPPVQVNSVVIVSNLQADRISCDSLFVLFGVYGEIWRIKIMFNKKDTALVQYKDPVFAQNAATCLDNARWYGKTIKVSISKHNNIQMPRDAQTEDSLTKDFSNSRLQRIIKPSNKHYGQINAPSNVLHVINLPESMNENELGEIFSKYGSVEGVKFLQKEKKMALVQMGNIEEAIMALVELHNFELPGQICLKISFTKSHL